MCDPLVGGLIAGAASLGSGLMQMQQTSALQSAQQNANDQWVAYQTQIHRQQALAQDQARNQANAAREQTLQNFTPENQQQLQQTEAQRLNTLYTNPSGAAGTPSTDTSVAANDLLSGESSGNKQFMTSLTNQVNQATSQARGRIAALATAGSYGGSFGGLGTVDPIAFQQGGNAINLQNAIRQSNLQTYGVQQQVQPIQYTTGPNFGMAGSVAKALSGVAGAGLGAGAANATSGLSNIFSGGGGNTMSPTDWNYVGNDLSMNPWG